jgi:hypothetical protein
MPKRYTQAALAAKEIKKYIKSLGVNCSVRSNNFSMGDSVDITVYDQHPDIIKKIRDNIDKYEYGTFDGMNDCQGIKNRDFAGPQAKYVHINNELSTEIRQAGLDYIRKHFNGCEELPELYNDNNHTRIFDEWTLSIVHRLLNGSMDTSSVEFWNEYRKPEPIQQLREGIPAI